MKIFLSSTAEDLTAHRLAALAIERLELTCVGHETFTADERRSLPLCLAKVRECDLVVAIVAQRYGWVPAAAEHGDGKKSITGDLAPSDGTAWQDPDMPEAWQGRSGVAGQVAWSG